MSAPTICPGRSVVCCAAAGGEINTTSSPADESVPSFIVASFVYEGERNLVGN